MLIRGQGKGLPSKISQIMILYEQEYFHCYTVVLPKEARLLIEVSVGSRM